jgi:hypothetical protein
MWTEDDRAWAIALLDLEADTCSCGQSFSEATQPDAEGRYKATPVRCHACATRDSAARKFLEGAPESASDGLRFNITRK